MPSNSLDCVKHLYQQLFTSSVFKVFSVEFLEDLADLAVGLCIFIVCKLNIDIHDNCFFELCCINKYTMSDWSI